MVLMGVFHFLKNSGNSGRDVNGTRLFGSFRWKFSGIKGTSEKVILFPVETSQWKFVFHLKISRLSRHAVPSLSRYFSCFSSTKMAVQSSYTRIHNELYELQRVLLEENCWLPK